MPLLPGSGGGAKDGGVIPGSAGGALVRVNASRRVTVDGTVSVNGSGPTVPGDDSTGGGAGGGIYITCRIMEGGGLLAANGGAGAALGGGGGGGRIAILTGVSNFVGTASVSGGGGWAAGDPGTVAWQRVAPAGTLCIIH
jgi:hypothetical protein